MTFYKSLDLLAFLPSIPEVLLNCITLTNHLLTHCDDLQEIPLGIVMSAQQAKFYTFTCAHTVAKGKTANIYTDCRNGFRVTKDFGMLWKQYGFLTFSRK